MRVPRARQMGQVRRAGCWVRIVIDPCAVMAPVSAVPVADPQLAKLKTRQVLVGDVPSPTAPPAGCRFHTRCPRAQSICGRDEPPLEVKEGGNLAACHFPLSSEDIAKTVPTAAG